MLLPQAASLIGHTVEYFCILATMADMHEFFYSVPLARVDASTSPHGSDAASQFIVVGLPSSTFVAQPLHGSDGASQFVTQSSFVTEHSNTSAVHSNTRIHLHGRYTGDAEDFHNNAAAASLHGSDAPSQYVAVGGHDHDSTSVAQSIPASVSQSVDESSIVSEHRCTSVVDSSTSAVHLNGIYTGDAMEADGTYSTLADAIVVIPNIGNIVPLPLPPRAWYMDDVVMVFAWKHVRWWIYILYPLKAILHNLGGLSTEPEGSRSEGHRRLTCHVLCVATPSFVSCLGNFSKSPWSIGHGLMVHGSAMGQRRGNLVGWSLNVALSSKPSGSKNTFGSWNFFKPPVRALRLWVSVAFFF